jgi:hypothetical protein
MRDRQNPDDRIAHDTEDVIGEYLEVYPSIAAGSQSGDFVVFSAISFLIRS